MSGVHLAIGSGRPLAAEVQRIAIALADDAVGRLHVSAEGSRETAVHETRKRFKELRALLRLIERAAGRRRTKEWRRQLRDAGRSLSGARDADALHETFEKLEERFGASFVRWRAFTRTLVASADAVSLETEAAFGLAASFRDAAAIWSFEITPKDVTSALRASVRAARLAMRNALDAQTAPAFHEWRKREKDLWYHARMTAEIVPGMREREPLLRRLARTLGDHHDLVILREITTAQANATNAEDAIAVMTLARTRMRELEGEAETLGHEVLDLKFSLELRNESALYQAFALA